MNLKLIRAAVAVLAALHCTSQAKNDLLYSQQFESCMDRSNGVTVSMLDCIAAETKIQDNRLNGAYRKLLAQLSPGRKQKLIEVQRLWIRYREANCGFYADPDGGTMATVATADCFLSATASRAKELENFAD